MLESLFSKDAEQKEFEEHLRMAASINFLCYPEWLVGFIKSINREFKKFTYKFRRVVIMDL